MEKVIGECSTNVKLSDAEAKEICRLRQGGECCAFLAFGVDGFECIRMDYPNNTTIFARLKNGSMRAKGAGGWKNCAWEGEI